MTYIPQIVGSNYTKLCKMCKILQTRAKCAKYCKMCKIVQNAQNSAKLCKMFKIVQNVQRAGCHKELDVTRAGCLGAGRRKVGRR